MSDTKGGKSMNTGVTRRSVLKAGAAAGLLAGIAGPFIRTASAAEPIKLGVLLPKSGTYAVQGEQGHNGSTIAVDDIGGKVLDRPVQLVWLDENGPQTTQQNMHKLVQEHKVVAVQGGVSSGDVLAIMPVADREKILLMATGPNATEITGANCSRYTFRVDLPNYETVRSLYPSLSKHGKNWYFLYASYAWGIDGYKQMNELLIKDGGKVVGADQTPLGTTDFSSYILKLMASKPDVVFLGLGGGDMTNFLKQFHQMGLTNKIPVSSLIVNDTDLWAAGPDAATGIYPKIWNYTGSQNTSVSQQFAKKYQAKFGKPPESEAWQDWFGCTAILTAIKETGSTQTDKLVEFMESHKFDGYKKQPIYFRPWDHQLIQPTLLAQVKPKIDSQYDYFDIVAVAPDSGQPLEKLYGSTKETECKLKA
jgi:branched-chain amino acid transport system substrate-binding protein